jgi:hypothetical protein
MGENVPTTISCTDLTGAAGQAFGTTQENIILDTNPFLAQETEQRVAQTMVHEIAHNKSFWHPSDASAISTDEYRQSVNEQAARCATATDRSPNGFRRSSQGLLHQTAPVGKAGGVPFTLDCGTGQVIRQFHMRTSTSVVAVAFTCGDSLGSDGTFDTGVVGGAGGTPAMLECFPGEVMVGLHGTADQFVNSVGPLCASLEGVLAGSPAVFTDPAHGGTGGVPWQRQCPDGMVVRGVIGRAGALIDRMQLLCVPPNVLDLGAESRSGRVGAVGPVSTLETCGGRGLMAEYNVYVSRANGKIARLGGRCAVVSTSLCHEPEGCRDTRLEIPSLLVPSHGGAATGSVLSEMKCTSTQGLIGFSYRVSNGQIVAIRGLCADAQAWSSPERVGGIVTETPKAWRGLSTGTVQTVRCPLRRFVTGWQLEHGRNTDDTIRGMELVCRDFEQVVGR